MNALTSFMPLLLCPARNAELDSSTSPIVNIMKKPPRKFRSVKSLGEMNGVFDVNMCTAKR